MGREYKKHSAKPHSGLLTLFQQQANLIPGLNLNALGIFSSGMPVLPSTGRTRGMVGSYNPFMVSLILHCWRCPITETKPGWSRCHRLPCYPLMVGSDFQVQWAGDTQSLDIQSPYSSDHNILPVSGVSQSPDIQSWRLPVPRYCVTIFPCARLPEAL